VDYLRTFGDLQPLAGGLAALGILINHRVRLDGDVDGGDGASAVPGGAELERIDPGLELGRDQLFLGDGDAGGVTVLIKTGESHLDRDGSGITV